MQRTIIPVRLSKTAAQGTKWQIWDGDLMSTRYHGAIEGYNTKADALAWIKRDNANNIMSHYKVVRS